MARITCSPDTNGIHGALMASIHEEAVGGILRVRGLTRENASEKASESGVDIVSRVIVDAAKVALKVIVKDLVSYRKTLESEADIAICDAFIFALKTINDSVTLEGYNGLFGGMNIMFPSAMNIRGIKKAVKDSAENSEEAPF